MSRSYRTQQPRAAAVRKLEVADDGKPVLPRIVTRRPSRGDVHPLTARALRNILRSKVPPEYLYGIARIELRPRPTEGIGKPFASYLPGEKVIHLYSLPMTWMYERRPPATFLDGMTRFFAFVTERGSETWVVWPAREVLAVWYFIEVFAHELGHHYRNQYRIRRGSARGRRHEEFVADLHSARFYDAFVKRLKPRRARFLLPSPA